MKPIYIVLFLFLVGCEPQPAREVSPVAVAAPQLESNRFAITIVAEFPCNLAYGGTRRIYEIEDHKTGRRYLSVTGMGLDRLQAAEDAQDAADAASDVLDAMGD